jgi:hypothetical protein
MAKIVDNKIFLTNEETNLLKGIRELELVPNQKGIFLLIEKNIAKEKEGVKVCVNVPSTIKDELKKEKEEVIKIIKEGKLNELVEGKLEEKLNEKQKKALIELKTNKQVIVFKLNENYKKGVYKLNEAFEIEKKEVKKNKEKNSEDFKAVEKTLPDYDLELDGFIATKNTERARSLSNEFRDQIENKELQGIRSFEGIYYLIETKLKEKYLKRILELIENEKELSIEEIAQKQNISIELTKIICEFLKEEGELLEKNKGKYTYIN